MMKSILLLLVATCYKELDALAASTETSNRNSQEYPTTGTVYTRVRWIDLGKLWVPNAMQSGDLIWGAQIAILGYTLALLAFGVEWLVRRAQFA